MCMLAHPHDIHVSTQLMNNTSIVEPQKHEVTVDPIHQICGFNDKQTATQSDY